MWIRVATWNILASCLATEDSFPCVQPEYLEWSYRLPRIIEKIGTCEADIVVLQEVDR